MILRLLGSILLGGGIIGCVAGYCTTRWLDQRRRALRG